ncbi:hypothetical protein HT031_002500 [Scenedesmus sp. PABB004]|nr:hypothetical protein HT031_002500 [Scenedesmus sp. PABB004]
MRLVLGYYDSPAGRGAAPPAPPVSATVNNLQALRWTAEVDPYYRLALLSYRAKLANAELAPALAATRSFLDALAAPDFVPHGVEAAAAAAAATAGESEAAAAAAAAAPGEGAAAGGGEAATPAGQQP